MSNAEQDLSKNPFVALFRSIDEAKVFQTSLKDTIVQSDIAEHGSQADVTVSEITDSHDILITSNIIENVFLITLDKSSSPKQHSDRVFLKDLSESLEGQEWLDLECLEQAVFERVMLDVKEDCYRKSTPATESNPIRYLCDSFTRLRTANRSDQQAEQYDEVYRRCEEVIWLNSRLCFQQPDLLPSSQPAAEVFVDLLTSSTSLLHSDLELVAEYFETVAVEIDKDKEEGTVLDVFRPALDVVLDRLSQAVLSESGLLPLVDLIVFFTRKSCLAEALVEYNKVRQPSGGKRYESTLLGSLLSLSCLMKPNSMTAEFFEMPGRLSQAQVESTENMIYQLLEAIQDRVYQIVYALLKFGGAIKEAMLDWLGGCLYGNAGRSKMWSHHMLPQMFNAAYSSDAFFLNFCVLLLRLSEPITARGLQSVLRVQPTYCLATLGDRATAQSRKVHMIDVKETCLLPTPTDSPTAELEPSYTFTTECFFMMHFCLSLGFRVLHERLVKLNQDLHQIQGAYRDLVQQGSSGSETSQRLKEDMERIMTVYLCHKAAVTQPRLLDLCFTFHVATAAYLVAIVTGCHGGSEAASKPSIPTILQCIPELLIENVQDFMLFLRRFKDQLFEQYGGEELGQLLTFILTFMGSPEFVRNPHLRAGMAEALETLLPPQANSVNQPNTLLASSQQREQLFESHPMVEQLATSLVNVFVSIEMTGQGVQFEQKFKYRQPMYVALKYLWQRDEHRATFKKMSAFAEQHIEDTDAPLFLRFVNLLINDAIYLLDEALSYLVQLKEKQESRGEAGAWPDLPASQRQEAESGYRHMSMLARFHNIMGNETIHALEMITTEIRSIFTNCVMVDRIAAMLNYFLLHLAGPKQKNLKVKSFEEFQFKPGELVASICKIYVHLGENDDGFCRAVSRDGRSYSRALFEQAEVVLCKIHQPADFIASFNDLGGKIQMMATQQDAEEEALANVPEDFLDPIMGDLMRDPVILPSSGQIVDRSTIARHILSDQFDPFNRQPLTMDMVQPAVDLKRQIDEWLAENQPRS